jgi:hypothetical protein
MSELISGLPREARVMALHRPSAALKGKIFIELAPFGWNFCIGINKINTSKHLHHQENKYLGTSASSSWLISFKL